MKDTRYKGVISFEEYQERANQIMKREQRDNKLVFTEEVAILKLATKTGFSAAHMQALFNWTTEKEELLKLQDQQKESVAHIQASKGWTTKNKNIPQLKKTDGWSVESEIRRYKAKHSPQLLTIPEIEIKFENLSVKHILIRGMDAKKHINILKNLLYKQAL